MSKSVQRQAALRDQSISPKPNHEIVPKHRSHSPTESIKFPAIIEKDNPNDLMQVQINGHQYKLIPGQQGQKNSYPNLTLMSKLLTDESQKKSLQQIMQKNPVLAASLNVYASSHHQMLKHKRLKKHLFRDKITQSQSEATDFNQRFDTREKLDKIDLKNKNKSDKKKEEQFADEQPILPPPPPQVQTKTNIIVRLNKNQIKPIYKFNYLLGKGNNEDIVRRVLNTRACWQEVQLSSGLQINLRWQQNYYGYNYDKLGQDVKKEIYNHFEFHKEITTKTGLVKNLTKYCQINKSDSFQLTPIVFTINLEDKNYQSEINEFVSYYQANMPKTFELNKRQDLNLQLPADNLRYVSPYRFSFDAMQPYNQSVSFTKPVIQPLTEAFLSDVNYLWLLKPADMNRGNGVHVFNNLDELELLLKNYHTGWLQKDFESPLMQKPREQTPPARVKTEPDANNEEEAIKEGITSPQTTVAQEQSDSSQQQQSKVMFIVLLIERQFVVQKYLEKPFLINQRKFDIRIWVLMTHQMHFFVFKEGYIRTSSEKFTLTDANPFIHLTNNAVQKYSKNYSQFEGGNQISFDQFQQYLDGLQESYHFKRKVFPRIKEMTKVSLMSVKHKLNKHNRKYCFEIFGYDFILDATLRPWLIEVNTNPCIEESSELLKSYIPRMLNDAFKLTIDQIIYYEGIQHQLNEDKKSESNAIFPVKNYQDNENMWEYLGNY